MCIICRKLFGRREEREKTIEVNIKDHIEESNLQRVERHVQELESQDRDEIRRRYLRLLRDSLNDND